MEREEMKAMAKEIIGQTLAETIQTLLQTTGATTAGTTVEGKIDDIGGDEALEKEMVDETGVRSLNRKMTYDAYLHSHLENIGNRQGQYDTQKTDAQLHSNELRQLSIQAMQNAVTTSDMVAKNALEASNVTNNQTIDHRDLSFDRQLNVDEQTWAVEAILRNPVFKDALAVLLVDVVNDTKSSNE